MIAELSPPSYILYAVVMVKHEERKEGTHTTSLFEDQKRTELFKLIIDIVKIGECFLI